MASPKYPTTLDNDPPLLENDHDTLIGESFAFNSEIIEAIQAFLQPSSSATVGTLTQVVLGSDAAPYANLVGVILATCRIQTGVSTEPNVVLQGDGPSGLERGVYFALVPFQEGKFTEPPFVVVQVADDGSGDYEEPLAVDRVTTDGFRVSQQNMTANDGIFYWIAIQPPFGWKTNGDPVVNDPVTPTWFDGT